MFDEGKVVGQVSATSILRANTQHSDPLTGLPPATALRAWAAAALERGHEITVLFIDLDNFGSVNKSLGHIVGDDMLRSVAQLLGGLVDIHADLLCRYRGDEFAIATIRSETEAGELMKRIQDAVMLPLDAARSSRPVTISIGMAGGRRAQGRKRVHIAATIDDLLTLASRASTAAKEANRSSEPASFQARVARARLLPVEERRFSAPPAATRLRLLDVRAESDENGAAVDVTLMLGSRRGLGRATVPVHGRGGSFLAAEATLEAIRQTAGEAHTYVLEEVTELPTAGATLTVAGLG